MSFHDILSHLCYNTSGSLVRGVVCYIIIKTLSATRMGQCSTRIKGSVLNKNKSRI